MIDVYASVEGRDLGGVPMTCKSSSRPSRVQLPRGSQHRSPRPGRHHEQLLRGSGRCGLVGAIVLVYLLIVVNFQSWLDPFIIITALPGALAGICWMLLLTHTTLSVPSLTGTIMCCRRGHGQQHPDGLFRARALDEGLNSHEAALEAGYMRIRPVIMTALAMIIGMVPMASGSAKAASKMLRWAAP